MKIFIDFDNTLYDTKADKCTNVGQLLLSYLNAPLFDNAKEVVEEICKNGHTCFGATARGSICEEELSVTKLRLRKDGFFNGKESLISGVVPSCTNKYDAIKHVFGQCLNREVQPHDCILIDDCLEGMLDAADHQVFCILFAPNKKDFEKEELEVLNKNQITVAHSWQEIRHIVDKKCQLSNGKSK